MSMTVREASQGFGFNRVVLSRPKPLFCLFNGRGGVPVFRALLFLGVEKGGNRVSVRLS